MSSELVSGKIDYVREAILLLVYYASGQSYANEKKNYIKKNSKVADSVIEKFDYLQGLLNEFSKTIKPYEEELYFYFGKKYEEGRSPGHVVLCANDLEDRFTDLESIKKYWEGLTGKAYIEEFAKQINVYNSIVFDNEEDVKNLKEIDIVKKLMEMDAPDEEKWKLQDIFFFPEKHRDKLLTLMSVSCDFIKKHEDEIKVYTKAFVAFWTKLLKTKNIYEYIHDMLGIGLDVNPYGYVIKPSIFIPNGITIYANSDKEIITGRYEITMGILFDEEYQPTVSGEKATSLDDIVKAMKLLSDKSKLDILTYIKDKRAYGGELAKQLTLTPATISHHMSALLSAGLVQIEKEDTRVYYVANREAIERILKAVDSLLL